ncbi:hypothetical protein AMJ85_07410 [candidate division BRC1 bacterium SM23_51]|nr:MAG: hypothetical protein AMJ85_07410 [candidate division BRC1 bacterium SM23_51]
MKRAVVCLCVAAFLGATGNRADAADSSLSAVQLDQWLAQGEVLKVTGRALYDVIDGAADIHMGFSYIDSEHMTIRKGKWELEVSVFRVDTPDNAYGLYSCLRQRDGALVNFADESSYAYGTAVLWRGSYCVEVKDVSEEGAPEKEILAVCKALGGAIEGRHRPPELVRAFPRKKLIYHGLIYFHNRHPLDQVRYLGIENVLLLGTDVSKPSRVEAVYADYELPKGRQAVLAIRYPTVQQAAKALDLYDASVREKLAQTDDRPPWRTLTGKEGRQTIAFQKDRLLILAFDSSEPRAVRPIVEQIAKNLEPPKKPKNE